MLTSEEEVERVIRSILARAVVDVQDRLRDDHEPEEVLPMLVSTLVNLAWYIGHQNADISQNEFIKLCATITEEDLPENIQRITN